MIRYEYKMERVSLRTAGRDQDKLNKLGSKGFRVIQAVASGTDFVVLLMKTIEMQTPEAPKVQASKKQATKKDQQKIKDVAPVTKEEKEAIAELTAEE